MKSYQQLWQSLTPLYEAGEAKAIIRTLLEERYGMTLTDIVCGKVNELSADEERNIEEIIQRLQKSEPIQYILGSANFAGRTFRVKPGVLIPRPETAELCQWIEEDCKKSHTTSPSILDLCTGSGCIAITLGLDCREAKVEGWDISEEALGIALSNAKDLGAENVCIKHANALALPKDEERWDIIVSNPPYICEKEKAGMEKNVLEHEPGIALFVPDEAPLLFYRAIAEYAGSALKPKGRLYFEINPIYEKEMTDMLRSLHFSCIETREDAFGKKRMMKAYRPTKE